MNYHLRMGRVLVAFFLASILVAQKPGAPGKTNVDQERNAALLSG